jgi:branched-chain amino acid transport system permease protein
MSLLVSSIVTLAFAETMSIIAYNIEYLGGANSFMGIPLYTNLPIAFLALLLAIYVVRRYEGSRIAYAARATRDDPIAAAANGIDVLRVRLWAFCLGGAISALAGALNAHYTLVVNPRDLGFWPSFYIQVYVIFGGSYTMWGPILGAAVLTPLAELLRFAGRYRFAVYGLVLLVVLIVRPKGVLPRVPHAEESRLRRFLVRGVAVIRGDPESAAESRGEA